MMHCRCRYDGFLYFNNDQLLKTLYIYTRILNSFVFLLLFYFLGNRLLRSYKYCCISSGDSGQEKAA